MNQYETVFIINPVLSDEQVRETVKKFEDFITNKGGKIISTENWGLRKMAYPIQKKRSGFYNLVEFTAPGEIISAYELEMKRDERIMRFLTVALDKHAVAYAEKRRTKNKEAKKEVKS